MPRTNKISTCNQFGGVWTCLVLHSLDGLPGSVSEIGGLTINALSSSKWTVFSWLLRC